MRVSGIALADETSERSGVTTLLEGARQAAGQRRPRLLVSLLTAQFVVVGALDVLFVVIAIEVLGKGQEWVGYLNTAYGAGAVAAGLLTAHLLGRRLGLVISLSIGALSAGLVLTAAFHAIGVVVALIAVVGAGRAVLLVAANTMLQRVVSAQVIGRVFGLVEGLSMAGLALGAVITPLLIGLGGYRLALIVVGCLLPATALAGSATLRQLDAGRAVPGRPGGAAPFAAALR